MNDNVITYRTSQDVDLDSILTLYRANNWSSAKKPDQLYAGLMNSHSLVTAWDGDKLVGLTNALSDGHLVVYYSHAVVLPEYQRRGIGRGMMKIMLERYAGFHQHAVIADGDSVAFYESCGFVRAGKTVSMWIFDGDEH